MDSITQIVLGAAVGEAVLGKKAGGRAAVWGAVCGTIPDLDVVANLFMGEFDATIAHRGLSHSILFCVVMAPAIGWGISKITNIERGSQREWTKLAFWALFTHPLLDSFTSWGTQLFYPFWDYRVAFNSIFVADPVYTVPFLICLIIALVLHRQSRARRIWNWVGIGISSFYLFFTLVNKLVATAYFEQALHRQGKSVSRLSTYPGPLNNVLWYCVAEEPNGYDLGYFSLLGDPSQIHFRYIPKNHRLLEPYQDNRVVQGMAWMSKGYHAVGLQGDTLIWHDLRFGTLDLGPKSPLPGRENYAFSYKLIKENDEIVEIEANRPSFDRLGPDAWQVITDLTLGYQPFVP
jgi:inner membrane protein